jgi:hypothetical protein
MHSLFKSLLLKLMAFGMAFGVTLGIAHAGDIPGYIGSQSFRLTDDSDLNNVVRRAEEAKVELVRSEQAQNQIGDQLRILETQLRSLKDRMDSILRDAENEKGVRASLVAKLEELKKTPEVNAEAIANLQKSIEAADASILEKNKQAGSLKLESAPLSVRIDQIRNDFNQAARRAEESRQRLQIAVRDSNSYREEMIVALKKINYEGSRAGEQDGTYDGSELSKKYGYERGLVDGRGDGQNQGTLDGQDRYYRRGAEQGERDGAARARLDGVRDGTNEGTISGNRSAGAREGRAAGIKRGDASNAAAVGTEQGKKAGLERAVKTGAANGRANGESETTKKMESGALNSVNLNGQFSGSFQTRSPEYTGDFNGPTYRPNISHSKDLMRKAYADGYIFNYRQYTRYEYLAKIDASYNYYYDDSYKAAYDSAVGREYPAYFDQGRREADARAYGRDYPIVKGNAYKVAYEQLNANPNRGSSDYKTSYTESELLAYNERYEDIRRANYEAKEVEIFAANIAAQTEIYRQKRTAEVSAIYTNNAILEFVSSEMTDGGIKDVAKLDGVFQPGETTNHNIVLRNYGQKAATNVSAVLENGQSFKLPSIPARSLVVIKGAAQSEVKAALNESHKSSLRVVSALTSNDAVEARHFDLLSGGILKSADVKTARVAYPIALSSMSLESQLLKGTKNKLKVTLTNNSSREYKGELKIKLLANSQNGIITKEFSSVKSLATSATLTDAEILVESEQDAYRDLSISAQIEQDGVVIGVMPKDFMTMAKAQFADKGKVPVIVANTDTNLNAFLDVLSAAGGSDKVSILDLSLSNLNAGTIAGGLSQKVLLVVDDANAASIKSLNGFIGKSKSSTFVFVDDSATGLKNALTLASLKDAPKLYLNKRQIAFSNPHRAAGVTKSSAFFQSSFKAFFGDLAMAQALTMSAPEMIAEIKLKVSPANIKTASETIKMYSLKALSEILAINVAYDESGGIFSRDKKWAKMIADDSSLFINQMKAASSGDVVVSKLPLIIAAASMKDTISNAMRYNDVIYKAMMSKISGAANDVLSDMEDSYNKNLKKDFKELYNRLHEESTLALHRPFAIEIPQDEF